MMLDADVYDVSPSATAVGELHEHGIDPWVVDFGEPSQQEGGLERNLTDHVLAVSNVVDFVRKETGRDVHLAGYSQGGMFCYQTAALRRGEGLSSLITFGSPADTRAAMPFGLPEAFATGAAGVLAGTMERFAVPAWMSRTGFRMLDPMKSLRSRVEFIMQLHDREALLPRERQRQFLEANGWVAWPGPGAGGLPAPVHRPQPHARGRLRDRGPAGHARRHPVPDPDLRRRGGRDRAAARRARDQPRRAAGRHLRGDAARRALRPRGRLDGQARDVAGRRGMGALARR